MPQVTIYAHGKTRPSPGYGGWAALLIYEDYRKNLSGNVFHTTYNRMELIAVCEALEGLKRPCQVDLHTSSYYLKERITTKIDRWKKRGWLSKKGKPVANQDLWKRLLESMSRHQVEWIWANEVSGNAAHQHLEQLANCEISEAQEAKPPTGDISKLPKGVIMYSFAHIGAWTVWIADREGERELSGEEENANSYKMALVAAVSALESIKCPSVIEYYTDNETLLKGATIWVHRWVENGWLTIGEEPIKYQDLWERLYASYHRHKITWKSHHEVRTMSLDKLLNSWWRLA